MLYVSNRHFCFFAKQNIKFCFRVKDSVWIGYSNILTKLAANPFCFKKQALELRTVDSIFQKLSALQTVFKIFFSWFYNLSRLEKTVARTSDLPLRYVGPKFPQFHLQKCNFYIRIAEIICLTNFELRISNYLLKFHKLFWQCFNICNALAML